MNFKDKSRTKFLGINILFVVILLSICLLFLMPVNILTTVIVFFLVIALSIAIFVITIPLLLEQALIVQSLVLLIDYFIIFYLSFDTIDLFYEINLSYFKNEYLILLTLLFIVFAFVIPFFNSKFIKDRDSLNALIVTNDKKKLGTFDTSDFPIKKYYFLGIKDDYLMSLRDLLSKNEIDCIIVLLDANQKVCSDKNIFFNLGIPIIFEIENNESILLNSVIIEEVEHHSLEVNYISFGSYTERLIKRGLDIIFAILGVLIAIIVGIIIYPIVQIQSPGPLIFKQKRIGKNGKEFEIYKFRSMYLDSEERKKELANKNEHNSDFMFKMENDPRIFPFGNFIRKFSLDELPQFYNVFKGEMSLVGTRPPTVEEYSKYELHHFKRLAVKPGITGMWQVNGRSNIKDFDEVVKLDTEYIRNWSIWLDIKILLKTPIVVLKQEGSK